MLRYSVHRKRRAWATASPAGAIARPSAPYRKLKNTVANLAASTAGTSVSAADVAAAAAAEEQLPQLVGEQGRGGVGAAGVHEDDGRVRQVPAAHVEAFELAVCPSRRAEPEGRRRAGAAAAMTVEVQQRDRSGFRCAQEPAQFPGVWRALTGRQHQGRLPGGEFPPVPCGLVGDLVAWPAAPVEQVRPRRPRPVAQRPGLRHGTGEVGEADSAGRKSGQGRSAHPVPGRRRRTSAAAADRAPSFRSRPARSASAGLPGAVPLR